MFSPPSDCRAIVLSILTAALLATWLLVLRGGAFYLSKPALDIVVHVNLSASKLSCEFHVQHKCVVLVV